MPLRQIRLFAATCNNASHVSSATDVVLGTFRYCVNDSKNTDIAKEMLSKVVRMMHHKVEGNKRLLREYGLLLRPKEVDLPAYKRDYDDLIEHLHAVLK